MSGVRSYKFLGVALALLATAGVAGAETPKELNGQASRVEADLRRQEASLDRKIGDMAQVGSRLEEAREQAVVAASRVTDLRRETRNLSRSLEARQREAAGSRARYEKRLAATYKNRQFDGMVLLLDSLFGRDAEEDVLSEVTARMLAEDSESMRLYKKDRRVLADTIRQLEGKRAEYEESREEHGARVEELKLRESELEGSIQELREEKGRTETGLYELEERIEELEARKRAELLDPPASGGGGRSRAEEARIAQEEIAAEPVEELPLSRYRKLYREAAEDYGFGPDWYVLMAVGKVESDHGANMGPSSAGALGPMQFLPSTWKFAGVDGNGDGVANVMDPEDAIPAAAKYLVAGGAPEDWYAALYTYNHAGWYVREVLEVAEQYRLLAGDDSVGPYGVPAGEPARAPALSENPAPNPEEGSDEAVSSNPPDRVEPAPEDGAETDAAESPESTAPTNGETTSASQYRGGT